MQALGIAMLDPSVLDSRFVEPREMTDPRAAAFLAAMYALRQRGEPVETVAVIAELAREGRAVDHEYALGMTSALPTSPSTVAPRLRELAVARQLRAQAERAREACERGDVSHALTLLRGAAETRDPRAGDGDHATLPQLVELGATQLVQAAERNLTRPPIVKTGLAELDDHIGGLEYGDLTIIGGDTSVGKTSTAFMMACAMSANGHRPGIVSVEDPRPRWARRAIAVVTGVPIAAQRSGRLSPWQWEQLTSGVERIKGTQVHFRFCVGSGLDAVIDAERALIRDHDCDVVFLDYIQAVDGVPGAWSRRDEMRIILSRAKAEANREQPVTLIALSQMRKRENETEKPVRADLYEANDIAQKADTILLLWKDGRGLVNYTLDKAKDDATGLEAVIERDTRTGMLRTTGDGEPYERGEEHGR